MVFTEFVMSVICFAGLETIVIGLYVSTAMFLLLRRADTVQLVMSLQFIHSISRTAEQSVTWSGYVEEN